ncbi:GerAB/ArcD/ProY family transporter [Anaerobacillus sp. MEB173]|uniref:GerAB/ArcD/ProY family transporter n=1 Tax=Anaerobacillus sp. MEB173 TaxID=3383345 RepID=UPI003F926E01
MAKNNNFHIKPLELNVSFISYVFASAILIIPRTLAQEVGTADGWISLLINGLLLAILISVYTRLQRNYPQQTLTAYIRKGKVGKWVANIFVCIAVFYFLIAIGVVVRVLSDTTEMYLLTQTPSEVIVAIMLLVTSYAVSKSVQGVVHLHLMFLPLIVAVLLFVIVFNIGNMKLGEVLPILPEGVSPVFKGILPSAFPYYGGFPIYLVLMSYLKKEDLKVVPLTISSLIVTVVFIMITISCYAVLTVDMTKVVTYPTMEIAKDIEIIGFLERFEPILLSIWIMTLFTTISTHKLLCIVMLEEAFNKNEKSKSLPAIISFLAFLIAFLPDNMAEVGELSQLAAKLAIIVSISGVAIAYIGLRTSH